MKLDTVRAFIVREFLDGRDSPGLTSETPLISSGVIDSVGTLKLVLFLEEAFSITVDALDITDGRLDTLSAIGRLVESKLGPVA